MTVTSRLQLGGTLDCTWLARMESGGKMIIHVEDNGRPLLFQGRLDSLTDQPLLIERASGGRRPKVHPPRTRPVSSSPGAKLPIFTVTGDRQDSYYACVLVIPTAKGFQRPDASGL